MPSFPKTLATIQGCDILLHADGHCTLVADADVDCDGSGGNPEHDPFFQPDTSLHHEGKALNAYEVPWIVLPPVALALVKPMVLGCKAAVLNRETCRMEFGVVGDIGPRAKVGEVSVEMARRLGLKFNPNTGGTSDLRQILYMWWPGLPAEVDGKTYTLQPRR